MFSRFARQRALGLLPFVALAIAVLVFPSPNTGQPGIRHITLDAAQFAFTPHRFEVSYGDQVILTLTASDVVHGFYLDGYAIERRIEPGISQKIEFVATQAGKFRYRCSVTCGTLHPFMIGELVVTPNSPFWRALGFLGVLVAGTLLQLRRKGANPADQVGLGSR